MIDGGKSARGQGHRHQCQCKDGVHHIHDAKVHGGRDDVDVGGDDDDDVHGRVFPSDYDARGAVLLSEISRARARVVITIMFITMNNNMQSVKQLATVEVISQL